MTVRRILLIGSGQGHLEVLRRFAQRPDTAIELIVARHAVASWGPVMSEGERVWRWKDRSDRAHLARYRPPAPKIQTTGPQ